MSRLGRVCGAVEGGFPRVSGDEPNRLNIKGRRVLFSPRERG